MGTTNEKNNLFSFILSNTQSAMTHLSLIKYANRRNSAFTKYLVLNIRNILTAFVRSVFRSVT